MTWRIRYDPLMEMDESSAVVEVSGTFADELIAREVADALNRWFAWIFDGSAAPVPELFEPLGVNTGDYAWALVDDVDWEIGPHARAVGEQVRVSVMTHDTYLRLAGLLRSLGAVRTRVVRES